MMLFIKDFALVMLIAGLVACPIGWMVSKQWLNNYFYRINISALPFILSLAVIALLTVLLIVLQTMRAARANPVKSLRTE
jgi:ABC-type antimicrobial peptide transport system permease subunit